jgi:small nuclear ribonucleoprotein (snRNP)-like protein
LRGASEDFLDGFQPVIITLKNGQTVRGVRKNGDLFSVQIMDSRERIQGYVKDQMKSVTDDTKSAMPIYGPDGLQGTPERTKGSKKSRIDKNNGWTDWDLKVAKMTGASRIEMDQRRNESRIWVEEFRERVRRQIAGREDGRLW